MLNHCEKERGYKHNMGTMHYEYWTEYSFPGMMLWIWEVTWTLRDVTPKAVNCNKTPKCSYKTEVRWCTESQSVQPHTEIYKYRYSKEQSQCLCWLSPIDGAGNDQLCRAQWQQLFRTATLAKGLAFLTTEEWTIISAVLWPLQFSCEKHLQ